LAAQAAGQLQFAKPQQILHMILAFDRAPRAFARKS
jgi:hypothetical protein